MGLKKALKIIEFQKEVIEKQEKVIKTQDELIKHLEKRVEEIERLSKEKSIPYFVKEDVRTYHHKSGQKEGHEGVSRETPEKIDEVKKWDAKELWVNM